ncbi:T9SS type A sorting domain-containing protein, partial [Bacteroidota bacterium]
ILSGASPTGGVYSGIGVTAGVFSPTSAGIGNHTITYFYTDINGCTDSAFQNINVNQHPVVSILSSLNSQYCNNESAINLYAYPANGTFSGQGISGSTFNPALANIGANQIVYSYTDANSCTNSDTVNTTVFMNPVVNISTSLNSAYCQDAAGITLSATPGGGIFSGSINTNFFNPAVLQTGQQSIIYSYSDVNGCSNSDTVSTIVNSLPVVMFTTTLNSNYCEDAPAFNLNAIPSGGVYSGQGVSASSFNPSQAIIGANQLIYSFTDANSCSNSDTIFTNVSALPSVSFAALSDVCSDVQQIILSGGSPASGEYSGTGVAPLSGIFYPSVAGPGLVPITYSYTDLNGCTNSDTENIRVVSTPVSNFTLPSDVCLSDTALITFQGTVGTSANFVWNFDYGVINSGSGSGPYQVSWDTSGIKQLSLMVTDSGCASSTTYNYTNVLSKTSNIIAIGSTTVCYGDSVILFANSGVGFSYQWLLNSAILLNDTNSFLAAKTAGNYSALVTNNYSCTDTSNTISVTINPLPIATFSVISNACTSDTVTVTYTGNATIAANYNWDFDSANVISGSGQGPYQILWNTAGTKVISLIVSENNCISSSYSQNVIINTTEAIITAIGNTTFCDGDSIALYANTGASLSHQWFKNNVLIVGANNPFFIASTSGSYHVVITNIITACSESSIPVVVTVNTINFNLAFTGVPTSFTAPPFIVSFNNQTPNSSNYYFYWDLGDGNNSTFMQPFHTYQFDGTYTVTLIAENIQSGCRDTVIKPNYISCTGGSPNPCSVVAEITPSGSAIICVTDSLLLTATSGIGWNYQWLYNGVVIPGADTSTLHGTLAGEYRVIVNDTVCSVTSNPFILGHHPSVAPVISSNDSIRPCTNDSMELFVSTFYNSYLWSTSETTQSIYVKYSGNYTVTTTDINSCALVSAPFVVNASLLQPPEICIVGVDSLNHNRIIWERSASTLVDSFFVYRESTAAGVYNKIGQLDNTQPSIFVDTNSNPAIRAYRYKLTASDTCGTETSMSDYHKTMHLTINKGLPGTYNLIWDGYHGFQFGSYAIYRGVDSTSLSLLTQIQSTLWSYTDLNPLGDTVFYQIEVLNSHGCYPDSLFSKANSNYNSSRSNVANTMAIVPPDTLGIYHTFGNNLGINIYPNPNDGMFTVDINSYQKNEFEIAVYNLLGEKVYSEQIQSFKGNHKHNINLSTLPKGIYNIVVMNDKLNRVGKVVIQ